MLANPVYRSLAAATIAIALAAGVLLSAARGWEAQLAGVPLALLQRAENAPDTGRVLWVDSGEPTADFGRQRGMAAKAIDAARAAGAAAVLLALPLEQASDSADLARIRSFLDGVDSSPDPAMRARLTAWVAELDHDAQLERSLRAAGNVVLLAAGTELPLERFTGAARALGFEPAIAADADGAYRRDRLLGGEGVATAAPSATLATWMAAHGLARGEARIADGGIAAGPTLLRTGRRSSWLPHYGRRAGEQGGTQRVTLEELADGKVAAARLAGHILVVGRGPAPIATPTGPGLWLGEALAQRIASLEAGNYATAPRYAPLLVAALLLGAILYAALLAPRFSAGARLTGTLLLVLGLLALELLLLAGARSAVPVFECGLALLLATLAVWVLPEPRAEAAPRPLSAVPPRATPGPRPAAAPGAKPGTPGRAAPQPPSAPPTNPPSLREISQTLEARREEPTRAEVADLLLGRSKRPPKPRLGRYELDRELGRGAMGTVYLGRDPRINRVVAIKAIPIVEEFADQDLAEARARFFREAEMAGRLKHPGIVTVYDAGEDGGIAWIAMEYVKGHLLSEYAVSDRLLAPAAVLELVARTAEALDYAHAQDVIHRDIKPANVMFDPATLETKITDFGIARLTNSTATRTGIVLGTPSFMAPEQLEGRNVTGRSDLFALGVTLFQLLAGQLPFRADSMTGLMDKIANAEHPPLHTIRPDLPACVSLIVDRALMKDPAARFATAGEMARALRACAAALQA
jgi:hypothetical protein